MIEPILPMPQLFSGSRGIAKTLSWKGQLLFKSPKLETWDEIEVEELFQCLLQI